MKENIVSDDRQFFFGFFGGMIIMIVLLVIYSKADSFIVLNVYHFKVLDYFFIVYTNVGDGLFSIAIAVILFFYKRFLIGIEILNVVP